MTKQFLKAGEVSLINGGYLSDELKKPIFNKKFYDAQKQAEYICTYAKLAEGKDFIGKEAFTICEIESLVRAELAEKSVKFIEKPSLPESPVSDKLKEEALNFIHTMEKSNDVDKINNFLQQFTIIKEFEDFGLFFEQDICKLNKIYKMEEIVAAVTSVTSIIK